MDYDALVEGLGNVVRAERYKRVYCSQEGFAYAAGLHPNHVGAVERGERNVSIRTLLRIADALKMPLGRAPNPLNGISRFTSPKTPCERLIMPSLRRSTDICRAPTSSTDRRRSRSEHKTLLLGSHANVQETLR